MPRSARRLCGTPAACCPILNRGHAREAILRADDERAYFLDLLARYRDRFALRLYHYCLMDNHFHLLLQLPDARLLAGLLVAYGHPYRRRYALVGDRLQNRSKSPAVEVEHDLLSWERYSERNPVEAGRAAVPWDYRWSSCRADTRGRTDALLATHPW